jgi:hypothetical protein
VKTTHRSGILFPACEGNRLSRAPVWCDVSARVTSRYHIPHTLTTRSAVCFGAPLQLEIIIHFSKSYSVRVMHLRSVETDFAFYPTSFQSSFGLFPLSKQTPGSQSWPLTSTYEFLRG